MEEVSAFCLNEDERLKYERHQREYQRYIATLWRSGVLKNDSLAEAFQLIADGHTVDEAIFYLRGKSKKFKKNS